MPAKFKPNHDLTLFTYVDVKTGFLFSEQFTHYNPLLWTYIYSDNLFKSNSHFLVMNLHKIYVFFKFIYQLDAELKKKSTDK